MNLDYKNFAITYGDKVTEQVEELDSTGIFNGETLRLMPDCHAGKGCVVGTCLTYTDKIIPNIVGVDLGCRVSAFEIIPNGDYDCSDLDKVIHSKIPSGNHIRAVECLYSLVFPYDKLRCWGAIKDNEDRYRKSMGTLGSGNHYIALEANGNRMYLMVHCGSRNLGLRIANYYQDKAIAARDARKEEIYDRYEQMIAEKREKGYFDAIQQLIEIRNTEIDAEPADGLCYIEGQDMEDYLHDVDLMRRWSYLNHKTIVKEICEAMDWEIIDHISSIHNYVDTEHKIIRKGAIAAYDNQLCLIPLNMADGTLIVRGKGNEDWLCSLPHGAGRILSRSAARRELTMEDYEDSMKHVFSSCVCNATIDEAPQSYKRADEIIQAIGDNAEIVKHLYPIYNFKAKD